MNRKAKNTIAYIVIVMLSLLVAVLLSKGKISYTYTWIGEDRDIESISDLENDIDWDRGTGEYETTGIDPWVLFRNVNEQCDGVMVSLREPAAKDITMKVYWTKAGDEALSEKLTESVVIAKGKDTGFIKLPGYPINLIRVGLSDDCVINKISVSNNGVNKKAEINMSAIISIIVWSIILFPILCISFKAFEVKNKGVKNPVASLFVDAPKEGHSYELDYLRTMAAVLVIMMHSICDIFVPQVSLGDPGYGILKITLGLSLCCNVLYVMLSGALILKPKKESIKDFYARRLSRVLIPTLCYFALYMFVGYRKEIFAEGFFRGIATMFKGLLTGRPDYMPHIWLVYVILGLYILAPFLRIIVEHITEGQLFGLIVAGFVFNALTTVLPIFGISFGIDTPIAGWMGVFFLGYYMTTEHAKKRYGVFMALGVIGLIAPILCIYFNPALLGYVANQTPFMWLAGSGFFAFFMSFKKIFGKRNVVIAAISKYNFSIMLVHILLLMEVVLPIGWRMEYEYGHLRVFIIGIILVCIVMSYLLCVIYDNTVVAAVNYIYGLRKRK